jgi:chromosomal replication initiator protein
VTRDDREIVSAVHRALVGKVGQERFAVWFGRGVRMEPCGTTLRIAAADTRLQFLRKTFQAELLAAARGSGLTLEFVVDPSLAADLLSAGQARPPAAKEVGLAFLPALPTSGAANRAALPHSAPRQPRRQFASLAEFVSSDANRIPFAAAHTAATQPGAYTPLTIVGPHGSGKTHLLEGIWRQVRTTQTLTRVVYLTAEQFTNHFLEALRHSGMPSFRQKVRECELLLIDDIQFFGGKQSTLVEFVNTIDALLRGGRQLVLSVDRPLAEIKALGPEVVTRLNGGLVCELAPADFAVRQGILEQLAARQGLSIAPEVLAWVAGQLGGDARQLAGALNRLQAASAAHERTIDLRLAQESLGDLVFASRRPVRLPEIVAAVCDLLGVESDTVKSSSKAASATLPRMLVMFLARKWTRAGLSEISTSLGRKSHSTVLSAQHKVTEWLAAGKIIPLAHGHCQIDDAITRIEGKLRLA